MDHVNARAERRFARWRALLLPRAKYDVMRNVLPDASKRRPARLITAA